jgi:heme A synthase
MEWMKVLHYAVAVIETAALLGALIFLTRAKKTDKNSPEKKKQTQKAVIFLVVFFVLTLLRNTYLAV